MARRLRLLVGVSLAALGLATPALADPIFTPILTAILGASLFATPILGTTLGAILTGLLTTALGIGLSLLLTPRPKTPPAESGIIAVQQSIPYRNYGYGRAANAGAVMVKEEISGWYVFVAAIAGHQIDAFEALYLNDDLVIAPITGNRIVGNIPAGADGRYRSNIVNIDTRVGFATETYYTIINALMGASWDTNYRGDSIASLAMTLMPVEAKYFPTGYPYGACAPRPVLRWALVYDWRDGTQFLATPSTWKWSQNAAICIAHWLTLSPFGFRDNFTTSITPYLSEWTQAANDCDDAMALKAGGTEPRYRINGFSSAESNIATTLLTMLQCCDGHLIKVGGAYRLKVGKYQTPTVIITDDDIAGVYFQNGQLTENKVNEATAKYTSPDNGYVTVDTDPMVDTTDQSVRPGAPRKSQLDLSWVQYPGQASRLLKREMIRQKEPLRGKLTLKWSGMNAAFERDFIVQSNSIPRLANVVLQNMKPVISAKQLRVEIDFIGSGPQIDTYSAASDETTHPTIVARPSSGSPPVPTGLAVVGELISDPSGASSVILNLSWDDPSIGLPYAVGLTFIGQYRLHDGGGGVPGPWVSLSIISPVLSGGRYSSQTTVVPLGVSLDVEIATIGAGTSAYCSPVTVSTALVDLAPLPPTWTSAVGAAGHATLSVTAPYSANFDSIQFYRALSGGTFSSSTPIGSPVVGARAATITYTDTHSAGSFDYFAVALTTALVGSAPAGPRAATIT
jgi:hypothetical protein